MKHRTKRPATRTVLGVAAGLAVVAGASGVAAAQSPDAPKQPAAQAAAAAGHGKAPSAVRTAEQLTDAAAITAAEASLKKADQLGQHVTVAVVDRTGKTQLLIRGDGAGPQSPDSAERKAYTAVSWGQPTSKLTANAKGDAPSVRDIPHTLFLAGGVPAAAHGAPIAGIGVGGAPTGDIDQKIAQAGLDAIAKDLR